MTAPQESLVKNLKRAGEQVLGAKPLTGNDHVRLSALLKVAALELEALCAARDDAAALEDELRDFGLAFHSAMVLLNKLMDWQGVSLEGMEEYFPREVEDIRKVWG